MKATLTLFSIIQLHTFSHQLVNAVGLRSSLDDEKQQQQHNAHDKDSYTRDLKHFQKHTTKIVGGAAAQRGRFPYQVGLLSEFSDDIPFCGGSLIAPNWILSAAHCQGFATKVQIGRYDFGDSQDFSEEIDILREIPHPNYNEDTVDYDFMLIELAQESSITPVKIDDGSTSAELSPRDDMTVIGWGRTSSGGGPIFGGQSEVLLEVEVGFVPNMLCNMPYEGAITDRMLCGYRRRKDSCQGDSGGPLLIKGSNASEDVQIGVVSWGSGCGRVRFYPGVYSRISEVLPFINQYIEE